VSVDNESLRVTQCKEYSKLNNIRSPNCDIDLLLKPAQVLKLYVAFNCFQIIPATRLVRMHGSKTFQTELPRAEMLLTQIW
jgi:hypothetical protein